MAKSSRDCIAAVQAAAGRELKDSEVEHIFSQTQGRIRRYEAQGMAPTDAAIRAGRELGDEMRLEGIIQKRNQLINVARRRELEGQIRPGSEAADILDILSGRGNSLDAQVRGVWAQVVGPFVAELEAAGLSRIMSRNDKAFDREVARELRFLGTGEGVRATNPLARTAGEIIYRAQDNVRLMQNDAGAWIGKRSDYITRQSHDAVRIMGNLRKPRTGGQLRGEWDRDANFEVWYRNILPKLDEATFDRVPVLNEQSIRQYLSSTYNALVTGVHDTSRGANAWGEVGVGTGPANLARRVSEERKLIFRDADAWMDYHEQFGKGSLMSTVRSTLESGARNTALMRRFGPNPEAMLDSLTAKAISAAGERADVAAVNALKKGWNEKVMANITGKANVPQNMTLATITANVQAAQTLSKLGGVVLASVPDLAVTTAALRHNGVGILESYWNQFSSLMPKGQGMRETSHLLGAGVDGVLGNVASRFTAADGMRGTAARLVDTLHRWNGLEWWTDSMKMGVGTILSHNLGRNAQRDFAKLHPRLQTMLRSYGIEEADWNVARASAAKAADGRMHVLPGEIADAAVRSKFSTYYADQISVAMTEPDALTRTRATLGTQAGTYEGTAARLFMQFKTYPLTFMRRSIGREIGGQDGSGMDKMGLAHLMVATTVLGYVSMELKSLTKGRDTRLSSAQDGGDYAKMVIAAMAQGGGAGLYGDFLFGDSSRMGGGPLVSFLGPTVGTLGDVATEIQDLRKWIVEGDSRAGKDARSGAIGLIRENTPFVNLFYARVALDQIFWHRLQEAANPGYLSRYEERVRREQHQTFFLSPSSGDLRAPNILPQ